ncbi:5-enolpyruvylshikimate-3-phosphate synthase [Clostridium beijerinckii]|nr:5-enolpyruvylshikimate-3-phosphate synthase [Clostridium beijerinckii]
MGNLKIYPGKLSGEVKIPPSKSMAHRAVICAALGDGVSKVTNIDYSDDIIATIEAMSSLGAKITKKKIIWRFMESTVQKILKLIQLRNKEL